MSSRGRTCGKRSLLSWSTQSWREVLPVHLPNWVDGRHSPMIGMDASQGSGVHQDSEDSKAKRESQS